MNPCSEAVMDAVIKLRRKIANEEVCERRNLRQTHCYYSIPHQMRPVPPILTGEHPELFADQHSPQELAERAAIILALKITSGKKRNQT